VKIEFTGRFELFEGEHGRSNTRRGKFAAVCNSGPSRRNARRRPALSSRLAFSSIWMSSSIWNLHQSRWIPGQSADLSALLQPGSS